jgi:hypothetical protein
MRDAPPIARSIGLPKTEAKALGINFAPEMAAA